MKPAPPAMAAGGRALVADIRQMIERARHQVAQAVNARLTGLYWKIGTRIRQGTSSRNDGRNMAPRLSLRCRDNWCPTFGRGFEEKNLRPSGWSHLLKPANIGQVEPYLRWLHRHECRPGEEPPLAAPARRRCILGSKDGGLPWVMGSR